MEPKVVSLTSCIYPFDPYLVVDINIIDFSSGARWAVIQTTAALPNSTVPTPHGQLVQTPAQEPRLGLSRDPHLQNWKVWRDDHSCQAPGFLPCPSWLHSLIFLSLLFEKKHVYLFLNFLLMKSHCILLFVTALAQFLSL